MLKTSLALLSVSLAASCGFAGSAGSAGMKFLKLSAGSRPSSLGCSFTAAADDLNSIDYNPAGLACLGSMAVAFNHNEWISDIATENLSAALPLFSGTFGFSALYLRMGGIPAYDAAGNSAGEFDSRDIKLTFTYANAFTPSIKAGVSARFFSETIETVTAQGAAFDIGFIATLSPVLDAGLCAQNCGNSVKYHDTFEPLPSRLCAGLAYRPYSGKLLVTGDVSDPSDGAVFLGLGAEYRLSESFFLRAGYTSRCQPDLGLSAGLGIRLFGWTLDYAYAPYGTLDTVHNLTLSKYY